MGYNQLVERLIAITGEATPKSFRRTRSRHSTGSLSTSVRLGAVPALGFELPRTGQTTSKPRPHVDSGPAYATELRAGCGAFEQTPDR